MTIYEHVQRTLDLIERNLGRPLPQAQAAREAAMSVRSFQDWFWMLTGHSYKEYLVGRRLAASLDLLAETESSIVDIALACGYKSHESYTRAFRKEFGIAPRDYRLGRHQLSFLGALHLYKEMYMGVIVKDLNDMSCISFTAFGPEPENKAKVALQAWRKSLPEPQIPRRIFGHNVDAEGKQASGPSYAGYKFYAGIRAIEEATGNKVEVIKAGRFVVTGIEGSFDQDPQGTWIGKGWARMNEMIATKGYRVKAQARWFEEELEPSKPGLLRLDLYLEIE